MHAPSPCRLLALLTLLLTLASTASITFTIPPTAILPNPSSLPASTRATLFKHNTTLSVPLTRRNTFEFHKLVAGSYLFTVQARDHTFGPLRVDVLPADGSRGEKVEVYQTFWGNEWRNKGEFRGGAVAGVEEEEEAKAVVEVRPERVKDFYAARTGFDPISFLRSPMILMAIVSLALIVGIPYLTENMDEETKAEFEEIQAKNPLSQAANKSQNMQNFDLAGWMAGKSSGGGSKS